MGAVRACEAMTRILYVVAGFVAFPALLFLAAMCIDERRWDRP